MATAVKILDRIQAIPDPNRSTLLDYLEDHLEDVLDEALWQKSLRDHPEVLGTLAAETREQIRNGQSQPLDPDSM